MDWNQNGNECRYFEKSRNISEGYVYWKAPKLMVYTIIQEGEM